MKMINIIPTISACLLLIYACHKENSDTATTPRMVPGKSEARPGETVSFSVENGTAGAVARWSVTPDTNVIINRPVTWDQKTTITFTDTGTYVVKVDLKQVWCDSAAAANPGMDTCLNSGKPAGNAHATIRVKN
jgi:hypothetical protein